MTTEKKSLGIQEIMDLLPHRYPFLMVDKVENYEISDERKTLRAIKNVSFNEPIFQGHFPAKPVFPGVLILEAMAQATGILAFTMVGKPSPNELYYFASIDNARFKRPVEPGDQLIMDVSLDRAKAGIFKYKGVTRVGDQVACEAELMCTMRTIA